jgi:hypothetical protein
MSGLVGFEVGFWDYITFVDLPPLFVPSFKLELGSSQASGRRSCSGGRSGPFIPSTCSMLNDAYAAGHSPGDPFNSRCHFMQQICTKAGVKPFGFHAIRHLSAGILYKAGEPVAKIQKILRHRNATTTNRYLESLGFQLEEILPSVEVLARGLAEVYPFAPERKGPLNRPQRT